MTEPAIPCAVLGCRRARRPQSETGLVFGTCAQHLRFDLRVSALDSQSPLAVQQSDAIASLPGAPVLSASRLQGAETWMPDPPGSDAHAVPATVAEPQPA